MNFPGRAAPVFRIPGSDVFGFFRMAGIEKEPAFKFTPVSDQLRLQSFFRPIDSLLRSPIAELGRNFQHDVLALRQIFASGDQDVDIAAAGIETVCRLSAGIRDVDHQPLDARGPIGGPAITIVASLKQRIQRNLCIKVGSLRKRRPVLQPVEFSCSTSNGYPGVGTMNGENQPDRKQNDYDHANQQESSFANQHQPLRQ